MGLSDSDGRAETDTVAVAASETTGLRTSKRQWRCGCFSVSFVTLLSTFVTTGGFVFGYDIGVIGGVKDMEGFRQDFGQPSNATNTTEWIVSEENQGWIVGSFSLGCLAGALVAGVVSEWHGRRVIILTGASIFTVGGLLQALAYYLWMVFAGRCVSGLGVGVLSMSVPIYNAEISPAKHRGRLVSLNQLSINAGIMVSFLINLACQSYINGWRISLALQSLFSIILFVGMLFAPETPRYLMKAGQRTEALGVLSWIKTGYKRHVTSDGDVSKAVLDEINSIAAEIEDNGVHGSGKWREILQRSNFKRMSVGVWVQLFQQATGMNIIMYYSTKIFSSIDVSPYVSTAVVGIINFLTTFGTLGLVDKVGRKVLMIFGGLGMSITTTLGATIITVNGGNDNLSKSSGILVVFCVCAFVFFFALTWGPIAWVITSEIFPLRLRGKLVAISASANWAGNFAIAFGTPLMLAPSALDVQGTLFLMGAGNLAGVIFILLVVPETKGRSLETMDELFERRSLLESSEYKYYLKCGCFTDCIRQRHRYRDLSAEDEFDEHSDTDRDDIGNCTTDDTST